MLDDAIKKLLSDNRCAMISDGNYDYIKSLCLKAKEAAEKGDEAEAESLFLRARDLLEEEASIGSSDLG